MNCVNLIPSRLRDARRRRNRIRRWIYCSCAYLLLLAAACVNSQINRPDGRKLEANLQAATQQNDALLQKVNAAHINLSGAISANATLALVGDPPDWSLMLAALCSTVGNDAMLREIHLVPTLASGLPSARSDAFSLSLRGICRSQAAVSQFVQRLHQTKVLTNIKIVHTSREQFLNASVVSFDIECAFGDDGGSVASIGGNP